MPTAKNTTVLGVDLGGTKIHAGLYSVPDFKLIKEQQIPTDAKRGLENVLESIAALINSFADETTLAAGLGVPGYFNQQMNVLSRTPNIPFKSPVNLKDFFASRVKIPMAFDNDAKLFAFAEYELNWKDKIKDMVALAIGTGLGGGIVIDGKIYRGANGFAGEFGHASFGADREFEDVVSGKASDAQIGQSLGLLLSDIVHVFNPQVIVLGGSVALHTFASLEKEVWDCIRKRNVEESYAGLKIVLSKLENPATLGAALLASKNRL